MFGPQVSRPNHLAPQIVIVDGQGGCGKTMLSPIIASLDRVELLTYAYGMEHVCAMHHLNKMALDASVTMVRMLTDLQLYNTMMSREINFRPSDLSSAFRDVDPWRYIWRLWQKGDQEVPRRILEQRPILHLTTHNLLPIANPVFAGLQGRLVFIEVVRHPLYMIKQQAHDYEHLKAEDVRNFTASFTYDKHQLPFYAAGWEKQYIYSTAVEKAIYSIAHLSAKAAQARREHQGVVITVPFEDFVLRPWGYMERMTTALGVDISDRTRRMMTKQKVPRQKIADGIALKIYQRYGWVPSQASSEREELNLRREWACKGTKPEAIKVLDELSAHYEQEFMKDIAS